MKTICFVLLLFGIQLCSSFSPFMFSALKAPGISRHNAHSCNQLRARAVHPVKMQSSGGGDEDEEIVQISEEELRELVEKAGGTIEVRDPSTVRRKRAPEQSNEALTGFAGAFQPIMKLPAIVSYPLLILVFGAVSAIFLPLFGSGSIGSMTGRTETVPEATQPLKGAEALNACDETCVAKKKMARSCDIFPYSLTPTCTDPDIGNKGLLKNLAKFSQPPPSVLKERAAAAAAAAAADAAGSSGDEARGDALGEP